MYKGIFFMSAIYHRQGAHIRKSLVNNDTSFNMIQNVYWPRRHHTTIEAWKTWRKSLINLCIESKFKLRDGLYPVICKHSITELMKQGGNKLDPLTVKEHAGVLRLFLTTYSYKFQEKNDLPQRPNLSLHSGILHINWMSTILGFIPKSLAQRTHQTNLTYIGSKRKGLKWANQLITKIWKLIHGQCIHRSKL